MASAASVKRHKSGILNLERPSAVVKAIEQRNADKSPLLTLPPEIRNRIYSNVLGGHVLHIGRVWNDQKWISTHTICCADITDDEISRKLKENQEYIVGTSTRERHSECKTIKLSRGLLADDKEYQIDLCFLRTCRQIYKEASLIHFSDNTFSFDQVNSLLGFDQFVHDLLPAQRRAIRNLVIAGDLNDYSYFWFLDLSSRQAADLNGVRDLTILLERSIGHPRIIGGGRVYDVEHKTVSQLANFGKLPLASVQLRMYYPGELAGKASRDACDEGEMNMLAPWDGVTHQLLKSRKEKKEQDSRKQKSVITRNERGLRALSRRAYS